MRVTKASVRMPAASPMVTRARARARASSKDFMNAPVPHFTSSTSASLPSAIFLLMTEAQMSGRLSMVPVTSRSAYSFLSAGAMLAVWLMIAQPFLPSASRNSSSDSADAKARNRLELVEGAAGVTEAAPGHLGHDHAASGGERRQHDGDLVADPAGAVLADFDAGERRQIDAVARRDHGAGEVARFLGGHPAQDDGHQERRGLVVGPVAARHAAHEAVDGLWREPLAVAFCANDVNGAHGTAGSIP